MSKRATAAFVFSIIGATYHLISLYVAVLVDRSSAVYFIGLGYFTLPLNSFIAFWSASHLLEDWKGRITWPSIILGIGVANLLTVILAYDAQQLTTSFPSTVPSPATVLALIPGSILLLIGGILGFSAVRQYSREHGRAVISHA